MPSARLQNIDTTPPASPAKNVVDFTKIVKAAGNNLFAENFIKKMFGIDVWEKFESGALDDNGVQCDTFSIIRRPTTGKNFEYGLVQKGARSIGATDRTIRIISDNSERLHFAALVDNHLFHRMDGVRYETLMGDKGRTDVVVRAGRGLKDPVCYIVESKTANAAKDSPKLRFAAIQQVLSRLRVFKDELADSVAVSICIFDKARVSSSSASEYYSHSANDVQPGSDCEEEMKAHLAGSGMHIETYLLTKQQIQKALAEGDGSPLLQKPMSYAPAIIHGIEKSAAILPVGSDDSAEIIYVSQLKDAKPHPKLNPSGGSSSQNTRTEAEKTTMTLVHGILGSMFANYLEHLRDRKAGKAADTIASPYCNLGSNMREIHLIKGSYLPLPSHDLARAESDFKIAYLTTNISAPNSQHSQEAYMRIMQAVNKTLANANGRDKNLVEELMSELGLNQSSDPTDAPERLSAAQGLAASTGIDKSEFKRFSEYVGSVQLIGHVFACQNQAQSQRLSASSNASIKQAPQDMWLQRSRADINRATSSLSERCQRSDIPMPIQLPMSHDERFNQQMGPNATRVSIHEAAHWLSMDSWSKNEQAAETGAHSKPKARTKGKEDEPADPVKNKNEAIARAKKALSEILDEPAAGLAVQELWRNQRAYRNIFAASLGNTKAIYEEVDAHIFPAASIVAKIAELREFVQSELANAPDGQIVIDAMLGKPGSKSQKNIKFLLSEAQKHSLFSTYDEDDEDDGKSNGFVSEIQSKLANATKKFCKDKSGPALDVLSAAFEECCGRISDEMTSEFDPSRLHGAAHCALALGAFKAKMALDAIDEILRPAETGEVSKPNASTDKLATFRAEASQAELAAFFDKKLLNQCKFWTNALSFDRLVGMSMQLTRSGNAKGSIIPCGYDLSNPTHRDDLSRTVAEAATAAYSKIKELTTIPDRSKENIVSHEFRHTRSAANLAEGINYPSLTAKLIELGVPELPVNFYEYFLKHKWGADLSSMSSADLNKDSSWIHAQKKKRTP